MLKSVQHLDGYRIGGIDSGFLKVISRFAVTHYSFSEFVCASRGDSEQRRQCYVVAKAGSCLPNFFLFKSSRECAFNARATSVHHAVTWAWGGRVQLWRAHSLP
jgi:hypothetical protein